MAYNKKIYQNGPISGIFDINSLDLGSAYFSEIHFKSLIMSNSSDPIEVQFYVNGSLVTNSTYKLANAVAGTSGSSDTDASPGYGRIPITDQTAGWSPGNTSGAAYSGVICLFNNRNPDAIKALIGHPQTIAPNSSGIIGVMGSSLQASGDITGIKIYALTGSITAGEVGIWSYN